MPVYNALPYLDAAIASILHQTHRNLRLAIYDDHSSDGSYARATEWAKGDARIAVTRGSHRVGPSASAQAAAALSESEFVARMDADDIAHPDRLALQLRALDDHPGAVLIGSTFDLIDREGRIIRRAASIRTNGPWPPMSHSSITYRKSAFDAAGGYRPGTDYYEDQDLYRRMSAQGSLLILNRALGQVRYAGQHQRLRDDRLAVLRQIDRQFAASADRELAQRISPKSFYVLATLATFNLDRPHLLGLMVRHARFDKPLVTALFAGLIGLAEISPRLARGLNHLKNGLQNLSAGNAHGDGAVLRWDFSEDWRRGRSHALDAGLRGPAAAQSRAPLREAA